MDNQLELEHWWAESYRANTLLTMQRLRDSGRVSSDPLLRRVLNRSVISTFKRLQAEILEERGGQRSEAATFILKILESMEGIVLVHLVISATLNHLLGGRSRIPDSTLAAVGASCVKAIETEMRIRFIEKVEPRLYKYYSKGKATYTHKNRAMLTRAGHDQLPKFFDSVSTRNRLAMALAEVVLLSDVFEPYLAVRGKQRIWSIRVRAKVLDLFNRTCDFDTFLSCVPPLGLFVGRPPDATNRDGFLLTRRPLVSYNWLSGQRGLTNVPPNLVTVIQHLNNVPYRVNTFMLEYIERNGKRLAANSIIPTLERPPLPASREDRALYYEKWFKGESKRRTFNRTLTLAKRLANDTFYHDWFLDFRGRMYTSSTLLSPQGTPLNKSLIVFGETVTFTSNDTDNPAYNEFMLYGFRMLRGKADVSDLTLDNIGGYIDTALSATLAPSVLNDVKDYLSFVAWAHEADRLRRDGTLTTGLILRRDATASSIQHMAMMARDKDLMKLVNVTDEPSSGPSDLYASVTGLGLPRSSIKAFIMTYSYNSTAYGRVRERLEADGVSVDSKAGRAKLKEMIAFDKIVESSLATLLAKVSLVRDGLGEYGRASHYKFVSPSGMAWDGVKYEWPTQKVLVRANGAKIRVRMRTPEDGAVGENIRKTEAGFVANVIHSLDASMLHMAFDSYPASVAFIHDCFCGLPGTMDHLQHALTKSFVEIHKTMHENYSFGIDYSGDMNYDEYIRNSSFMFI